MFGRWVVTFMALSIRTAAGLVNLPVRRRIIAQSDMASHMAAMSLRPLFAILVAIGMFVAPLAIPAARPWPCRSPIITDR